MFIKAASRVKETSTTTGVGTYTLAGAATGYRTFSSGIGNGNICTYCATDGTLWETGRGTVGAGTLTRDECYASSLGKSRINWATGTRTVFCAVPGETPPFRFVTTQEQTLSPLVSFTWSPLPTGTQIIMLAFNQISGTGVTNKYVRVGSAADGIKGTGYRGVASGDLTAGYGDPDKGFLVAGFPILSLHSGVLTLQRLDASGLKWNSNCVSSNPDASNSGLIHAGGVTLTGELDRVQLLANYGGVSQFDAGTATLTYGY